jgi:TatD DNase family protein
LQKEKLVERETETKFIAELADAHCHADMIPQELLKQSIAFGVHTIVTNGVDTKSNIKTMEISDHRNIFPALGIGPESAFKMTEEELKFNIGMIKANSGTLVAIGEIGLDYKVVGGEIGLSRQRYVFGLLLDLANELNLPVSVHSRGALPEVLQTLEKKKVKKVQLHYFEGDENDAKRVAKLGYMVSIPPIESSKRRRAIMEIPMKQLMVESDCPAIGESPKDVEKAVRIIAETRGMSFDDVAEMTQNNTKTFFNIKVKGIMRS